MTARECGGTLQARLELLLHDYVAEYGEAYDRTTFLDFVVASLFEAGDVKVLFKAYEQRLVRLHNTFPRESSELTSGLVEAADDMLRNVRAVLALGRLAGHRYQGLVNAADKYEASRKGGP